MNHKYSLTVLSLLFSFAGNYLFSQEIEPTVYHGLPVFPRNLDYQKPVSTIPSVINVSGGNASYTIPLDLPPGINGMVPELSISYNSSAGNGVMGLKWSLNGLSEIRRGNKNHLFDGWNNHIHMNNLDRLYLDGQGLYCYSGSNLQSGSLYKTQNDDKIRLVPYINFSKIYTYRVL
jgi:hypothetical protein